MIPVKFLKDLLKKLQKYSDRWWYAPVIGFLALMDAFILVIPTDGLMIMAVLMAPKRWIYTFLCIAIGSSLGALALTELIRLHGMPLLQFISPGIELSSMWIWTDKMMHQHGLWAIFLIAISPLMQHPAAALAGLTDLPILSVAVVMFCGRALKSCLIAWIASHMPHHLEKLWGVQGEIQEVNELKKP